MAAEPKINDEYWFDFSKTLVEQSMTTRIEAAGKLQNLILWLWGIYTAATGVGFALSQKSIGNGPLIWIALASLALIGAYWCTVWVQMPYLVRFDPRSPDEIAAAYSQRIKKANDRMILAIIVSLIAAFLVSVALIIASTTKEAKLPAPKTVMPLEFTASILPQENQQTLAVTSKVSETKQVTIRIVEEPKPKEPIKPLFCIPFKEQLIQTSVPINENTTSADVILEWKDSQGMSVQLSRTVKKETSPEVKQSPTPTK